MVYSAIPVRHCPISTFLNYGKMECYFSLGNIQAIYYLGTMYSSGTGIVRSCRTATEVYLHTSSFLNACLMLIIVSYSAYEKGKPRWRKMIETEMNV